MLGFIERIQQKPLVERRRITFWTAFCITLAVAFIWVMTTILTTDSTTSPTTEAPSPLSTIFGEAAKGLKTFKNSLPF